MKKILSLLLAIVIIFTLAACKKSPNNQTEQETTTKRTIEIETTDSAESTTLPPEEMSDTAESEPATSEDASKEQGEDVSDTSEPASSSEPEITTEGATEKQTTGDSFVWSDKELGLRFVAPDSFKKSTELEGSIKELSNSFSGIAGIKVEAPVIAESFKDDARIYLITMSTAFSLESFFPDGITEEFLKESLDRKIENSPEMKYELKKITLAGKTCTAAQMSSNGILADSNMTVDMVYDVRGKSILTFMFVYNDGTDPTYLYNSFSAIS